MSSLHGVEPCWYPLGRGLTVRGPRLQGDVHQGWVTRTLIQIRWFHLRDYNMHPIAPSATALVARSTRRGRLGDTVSFSLSSAKA